MNQIWFAYIIYSVDGLTYNGITNNLTRRLKQHNQEISGGAKATRKSSNWQYLAYLSGFASKQNCLSCEWRIKHPDGKKYKNKKYCGISGRIQTLNEILFLEKWSNKCTLNNYETAYTLHILPEYKNKLLGLPPHITVKEIEI